METTVPVAVAVSGALFTNSHHPPLYDVPLGCNFLFMVYYAMKDEYQILLLFALIIVNSSNNHISYHAHMLL
jgi:hypothetical protein